MRVPVRWNDKGASVPLPQRFSRSQQAGSLRRLPPGSRRQRRAFQSIGDDAETVMLPEQVKTLTVPGDRAYIVTPVAVDITEITQRASDAVGELEVTTDGERLPVPFAGGRQIASPVRRHAKIRQHGSGGG